MSPAKTAELIVVPFRGLTRMGPRNHLKVLGVSDAVYTSKGIILSSIMAGIERDHPVVNMACDAAFCHNSFTSF